METVIKFEGIYKEYKLGVIGHGTLYRDIQSWYAKIRGQEDPNSIIGPKGLESHNNNILALNNINLDIKKGGILGVIGHNGAGKSTLLKVLSRITSPSKGRIKIKGRLASLLEVGTGFHPELTGRENIYLNGSINGLSFKEISNKLDEIVAFAEIEKFLDTPVKRFSTGMYVRLGFAVAAHLDPDILVVDEVLAVGDASFRKKAIDKMEDVSSGKGRTVIFVSHNMLSIKNLCSRAILMEQGKIIYDSTTENTINEYMKRSLIDLNKKNLFSTKLRSGTGTLRFTNITLEDRKRNQLTRVVSGEELVIVFHYETFGFIDKNSFLLDLRFKDLSGIEIGAISTAEMSVKFNDFEKKGKIEVVFDKLMLRGGKYILDLYSSVRYAKRIPLDNIVNVSVIDIESGDYYQSGNSNSSDSFLLFNCKVIN